MTKPLVAYPDPEPIVVDLLTELVADQDCTVGIGRPDGWTRDTGLHLQVSWDGTPRQQHPVAAWPTLRIVAWANNPGPAKDLALLAEGRLLAQPMFSSLLGVQPSRDPDTDADVAWFTVRFANRSQPVSGS